MKTSVTPFRRLRLPFLAMALAGAAAAAAEPGLVVAPPRAFDGEVRGETNRDAPPAAVDLRPLFQRAGLTPRHQGARGTCSVFAVTAALEFALAGAARPAIRLSPEYLNWAANQAVGKPVDGGFFSDLCQGYQDWGVCDETDMPYAARFDPARQPDPAAIDRAKRRPREAAQPHWIKRWNVRTGLTGTELASIRQALADGHPVCAGCRWPKQEQWQDGVLAMCPPAGVFDGHSVLLLGYQADPARPGGGTFRFYNPNRPDQECRMTWEYARAYMNDAVWLGR